MPVYGCIRNTSVGHSQHYVSFVIVQDKECIQAICAIVLCNKTTGKEV